MKKIITLLLTVTLVFALAACFDDDTQDSSTAKKSSTSKKKTTAKVVLNDNYVKMSFIKFYEEESIPGTCYVKLKVTNKSNKEITVAPTDSYVNDTKITIGSGTPMTLAPGKNSQTPFLFSYKVAGLDSIKDISKIETKFLIMDKSTNILETTKKVTLKK